MQGVYPTQAGPAGGLITNLKGHLLVATSELNGSFFERAVIFMCSHSSDGAMGVVINKPMDTIDFTRIATSMGIEEMMVQGIRAGQTRPRIFQGGPAEANRGFVLHTGDYALQHTLDFGPDIRFSAQAEIVADIAHGRGPRQVNFCLGYAGWAPGQLENELHDSSWLVVPADTQLLFETAPTKRYLAATRKLGLDALNFMETVGQA